MVEEMRGMSSFIHMELFVKLGGKVSRTIDCFTFGGIVKLVNPDLGKLTQDYERIREFERSGLFVCEE